MKPSCFLVPIVLITQVVYASTLTELLSRAKIDAHSIGCKCIMTEPSTNHTDTTLCMCFNRNDGSLNKSSDCQSYIDTVFGFCNKATDTNALWQTCVSHYCPCHAGKNSKIPKHQDYF